ncbi:NAD-dependent epimerase/dehydratase family protein [Haladaptatus sp. CMAA 1911]|uniref:NAD-dependent epimerase/dehydratase family protein n=1 Tax=unclassified Haladaptatus TaxID=2622732 RepID=UPI0037552B6A
MSCILITGGNGFVGREIARLAVDDGHRVRSIARSGRPEIADPWVDAGDWYAADVFEPQRWRDRIDGCDAVIHTIAAIRDSPKQGVTLERLNGDAAIIAGLEAERANVNAFVFLSAIGTPPFVSERYEAAKRRAERALNDLDLRTSVLRPGAIYGKGTNQGHFPRPVNRFLETVDDHEWLARRFGDGRPLGVEQVARSALHVALNSETPNLLETQEISSRFRG